MSKGELPEPIERKDTPMGRITRKHFSSIKRLKPDLAWEESGKNVQVEATAPGA